MKKVKPFLILFSVIFIGLISIIQIQFNSNCDKDRSKSNILINRTCNHFDSIIKLGVNFKPTDLELNLSLKKNKELNLFLNTIDERWLLSQNNHELFIAIILIKQYYFHLSNCHQGYDLLSMRVGNAAKIIHCFLKMAKCKSRMEMLNSGSILNYLKHNPQIRNNEINLYLKHIKNVSDSIKMEAYW